MKRLPTASNTSPDRPLRPINKPEIIKPPKAINILDGECIPNISQNLFMIILAILVMADITSLAPLNIPSANPSTRFSPFTTDALVSNLRYVF